MRRITTMLATVTLLVALSAGAALAAELIGNDKPNTIVGTDQNDLIEGKDAGDSLYGKGAKDRVGGGSGPI